MKILLYNPDNGVTRNFMPHLWMFLLQALTPKGHEVVLIDGSAMARGSAVHKAVETALRIKEERAAEKLRKMQAIFDEVASWPKTGLKADKAFFDEMSGD